jgi:hypothetical protein
LKIAKAVEVILAAVLVLELAKVKAIHSHHRLVFRKALAASLLTLRCHANHTQSIAVCGHRSISNTDTQSIHTNRSQATGKLLGLTNALASRFKLNASMLTEQTRFIGLVGISLSACECMLAR